MRDFQILLYLLLLLFAVSFPLSAQQKTADSLTITYLANEGFLIDNGDRQLIIDGLFRKKINGYAVIPDNQQKLLQQAGGLYQDVDLLLFTHLHSDHFDANMVAGHLLNNKNAVCLAGQDVIDLVRDAAAEDPGKRLMAVTPEWKQRSRVTAAGIEIDVLRMRHGWYTNYHLHHNGFIIHLGGQKILHIGDVEVTLENFKPFNLPAEKIDIAFIPYWMLIDAKGRKIVDNHIQAKTIFAMHIDMRKLAEARTEIAEHYSTAHVLSKSMEQVVLPLKK